jgi:superfamily I DNA/RNA helicase
LSLGHAGVGRRDAAGPTATTCAGSGSEPSRATRLAAPGDGARSHADRGSTAPRLRLSLDPGDDLAWRSILDCSRNGIGDRTITVIEAVGNTDRVTFAGVVAAVAVARGRIARGSVLKAEFDAVNARLVAVAALAPLDVAETIEAFHTELPASPELDAARDELVGLARSYSTLTDLADYLVAIALKKEEEQSVVPGVVNIMTMHNAQGLDACVVFVPAAEEEV